VPDPTEPADARRKRLWHRSRYRGSLESDILFQRFVERHLDRLTGPQLDRFEAMLDEADADILAWITGQRPVPARCDHDVLDLMRQVARAP
jgi:antitoxin CptB